MFVIETKQRSAAWKTSILMILALLAVGRGAAWLAAILTLHTYARPRPDVEGFRMFGFRLGRRG
jgi:hypothetical protein